jgi:hypothetical protein
MQSTVKLSSILVLGTSFLALAGFVENAQAAVIYDSTPFQTLNLNSANSSHIQNSTSVVSNVLTSGTWYKFVASGLWSPDRTYAERGATWQVDARFVTQNASTWTDRDAVFQYLNFNNFDFGLFSRALGGNDDNFWGDYRSDHTYTYEFLGQGQAADFYVNDIFPGSAADNLGGYTVNIYAQASATQAPAAPTPALLPGLLGVGLGVWRKRKGEAKD